MPGMIATLPGLGTILGGAYSFSVSTGPSVDWQPLDEPPADVIGPLYGFAEFQAIKLSSPANPSRR